MGAGGNAPGTPNSPHARETEVFRSRWAFWGTKLKGGLTRGLWVGILGLLLLMAEIWLAPPGMVL